MEAEAAIQQALAADSPLVGFLLSCVVEHEVRGRNLPSVNSQKCE